MTKTFTLPIAAPTAARENLARYRYHTGAQPRPLQADEACPPLFRDIGLEAMARFLQGQLTQLCGIHSPITYLRTADYREPYVDHGGIGRIMLLDPQRVTPWHSGIETVYIAPRTTSIDWQSMVFIPAEIPLQQAANRFHDIRCRDHLIETIGQSEYRDLQTDTAARLNHLIQSHVDSEKIASRLRQKFQSMNQHDRELAAKWMERSGLTESDLCTAWHHISDQRRQFIQAALRELPEVLA